MHGRAGPSALKLSIMVFACIVLGAMTTLGIAWACAAWVNAAGAASVFSSRQLTEREVAALIAPNRQAIGNATFSGVNVIVPHNPQAPTSAHCTQTTQRAFGHTRINRLTSNMKFDVQNGSVFIGGASGGNAVHLSSFPICEAVDQAGWPFRAFECSMPMASISTPTVSMMLSSGANVVEGGFTLPPDASGVWRALPYRPRWLGLIANVLLFSGLWFGVLLLPGIAKRRRRRTRGECIACGYDLRGVASERCPECWLPHGRGFAAVEETSKRQNVETSTLGEDEVLESPTARHGESPAETEQPDRRTGDDLDAGGGGRTEY